MAKPQVHRVRVNRHPQGGRVPLPITDPPREHIDRWGRTYLIVNDCGKRAPSLTGAYPSGSHQP